MLSREVRSCAPGGEPPTKFKVVKCFTCHSWAPPGSAAFLSATANRRVKTGMTLEIEYEDQLHACARV